MPVTLNEIASNTATVTVNFSAKSFSVDYHPLLITDEMLVLMAGFANMDSEEVALGKFRDLNAMLAEVIESWDLVEDDGTMVALTVKRLARVSPIIKSFVVQAILSDIRPETIAPQMNGAH